MRARFFFVLLAAAISCFAQPSEGRKYAQAQKKTAVDRWNRMSPEDRERALQRLTPERRERLRAQMDRFNNLPPEERDRLRRRYDQFRLMPPQKQARAREIFKELTELSPDRRRTLRREVERLRALPESERNARLESEDFRSRFSASERKMVRELGNLISPDPK